MNCGEFLFRVSTHTTLLALVGMVASDRLRDGETVFMPAMLSLALVFGIAGTCSEYFGRRT